MRSASSCVLSIIKEHYLGVPIEMMFLNKKKIVKEISVISFLVIFLNYSLLARIIIYLVSLSIVPHSVRKNLLYPI